jgi:hypothetical protein
LCCLQSCEQGHYEKQELGWKVDMWMGQKEAPQGPQQLQGLQLLSSSLGTLLMSSPVW